VNLGSKEGYARSISDSEVPIFLGLHTTASAREPGCNVSVSATSLLNEGASPILGGLERSNEGESQSQSQLEAQSQCSIVEKSGAAKDEQGHVGTPTQSHGHSQVQHPDTNTQRSSPSFQSSITAAIDDTPSFESQSVPGASSSMSVQMTPACGVVPSSPQHRFAGANPVANMSNFNRRRRPPNLQLDLSSSSNLKSGRHTSLYATAQPQASTCPGAGIGSISPSLGTVPTTGPVALDASPTSGMCSMCTWTSTPLQSPVSLNPAIFTTSTTLSNYMPMNASPANAAVGRIYLEPSMTNEGMPTVGVMPSPFEYTAALPYLSSSGSEMPDGHFDLREMDWSAGGSVVGTDRGHGQGQGHT
jgi:hypothetical protein